MSDFRLRDIAVVAYTPTVVSSIGSGAIAPMIALRARDLGADVSTSAFVVALLGLGMLVSALPAGAVVARLGERRTLLYAGVVDAVAMTGAALASSVAAFAVAIALSGAAWTAFLLARQGFMIEAVPAAYRARAMATLGGAFRVGIVVGPLLGAVLIHFFGIASVFLLAGACSLTAGLVALVMPDLGAEHREHQRVHGFASVRSVVWKHRRILLTLGVAVIVLGASRSVRHGLLPLWADHIGISASTTSLVFALSAVADVAMFYPGGWVMDHRGRSIVAVPVVLGVAVACLVLPLVETVTGLSVVLAAIALANGLGSGIVMTMGADTAPDAGRSQYLGAWRLCGDLGVSGGPLLVSALSLLAPLATVCVVVGVAGLAGSGWVAYWTRDLDRTLRSKAPVSRS